LTLSCPPPYTKSSGISRQIQSSVAPGSSLLGRRRGRQCQNARFNQIIARGPRRTGSVRAWRPRMAKLYSAAGAPRAGGNSLSATNGHSATPSGSRTDFRFSRGSRLLKRVDFRRVYDNGERLGNAMFALFFLRRETTPGKAVAPRIGFTVPRAVGKSVERNRIRRRMREAIRLELWRLDGGLDLVIHPRRAILDVAFDQLRRQVERAFTKCRTS